MDAAETFKHLSTIASEKERNPIPAKQLKPAANPFTDELRKLKCLFLSNLVGLLLRTKRK